MQLSIKPATTSQSFSEAFRLIFNTIKTLHSFNALWNRSSSTLWSARFYISLKLGLNALANWYKSIILVVEIFYGHVFFGIVITSLASSVDKTSQKTLLKSIFCFNYVSIPITEKGKQVHFITFYLYPLFNLSEINNNLKILKSFYFFSTSSFTWRVRCKFRWGFHLEAILNQISWTEFAVLHCRMIRFWMHFSIRSHVGKQNYKLKIRFQRWNTSFIVLYLHRTSFHQTSTVLVTILKYQTVLHSLLKTFFIIGSV